MGTQSISIHSQHTAGRHQRGALGTAWWPIHPSQTLSRGQGKSHSSQARVTPCRGADDNTGDHRIRQEPGSLHRRARGVANATHVPRAWLRLTRVEGMKLQRETSELQVQFSPLLSFPHQVPAMSQHPNCLSKEVALLLSGPNCHGKKSPSRFISNRKTSRQQTFPSHNLKTAKYHQISFLPSKKSCPETAHNN